MIYGHGDSKVLTRNIGVPKVDRRQFCLTDDDVLKLARYAIAVEQNAIQTHALPWRFCFAQGGQKRAYDLPIDFE